MTIFKTIPESIFKLVFYALKIHLFGHINKKDKYLTLFYLKLSQIECHYKISLFFQTKKNVIRFDPI